MGTFYPPGYFPQDTFPDTLPFPAILDNIIIGYLDISHRYPWFLPFRCSMRACISGRRRRTGSSHRYPWFLPFRCSMRACISCRSRNIGSSHRYPWFLPFRCSMRACISCRSRSIGSSPAWYPWFSISATLCWTGPLRFKHWKAMWVSNLT